MMKFRILALIGIVFSFASASFADEKQISTGFFSNKAVSGYDTVAYFTDSKAVKGKKKFKTEYQGADWFFASQENLDFFLKEPEKYAPQFGGYCAFGLAMGHAVSSDPQQWKIVDGKLYLNYNAGVKERWEENIPELIADAISEYPKVIGPYK
ncbi:MAG: YHS domain-containing protein [Kordiimonadaceae bacterium]|nr:YHS domain-containing protein [Kordiimonadaceae bacterium]